jgi:phosphoglycerol transferase
MLIIFAISSIVLLHVLIIYTPLVSKQWQTIAIFGISILLSLAHIIYQISDYFTGEGITTGVIYHVIHGQIGEANVLGAYTTLLTVSLTTIAGYALLFFITRRALKYHRRNTYIPLWLLYLYALVLILTHPLPYNIWRLIQVPTIDVEYIEKKVVPLLSNSTTDPLAFETYMPQTPVIPIADVSQKNLLLIYLEGIEQTFSDATIFPNLTPNLTTLAEQHTTFTNIGQIDPASFTIGGMVASQCGLPLFSSTSNESHEGMKSSFLGGATCLGDILKQYGYTNTYIGGAESSFAGKKTFLSSHGYDTIIGKDELIEQLNLESRELHNWGVYDDILFDTYYQTFLELSKAGTPFMLTTLTLDTHPPLGYVSPECTGANLPKQSNTMLDAIACTDYLIGRLIEKVQQSPYYAQTTIVIVSDHLAMKSDATKLLENKSRTNRILIIDNTNSKDIYKSYGTTLDTGTTILPYIGFQGRIGLGFDIRDNKKVPVRQAITYVYSNWYFDIISLWDPPIFTNPITINAKAREVTIENETYTIPSFINFTPSWESAITFRYALPEDTLLKYPAQMEPFKTYLLIEECRLLDPDIQHSVPYCVGYGSNNTIVTVEPILEKTIEISKEVFTSKAISE